VSISPPPIKTKKSFRDTWEGTAAIIAAVIVAIATIVGALIGGDIINISPGSAIQPPTPTPTPVVATTSSAPSPSASPSPALEPSPTPSTHVRRTTEGKSLPLTISDRYMVDLDSTDPTWDAHDGGGYGDLYYDPPHGIRLGNSDLAYVGGAGSYETCAIQSGYTGEAINGTNLRTGTSACVRTSEKRYALITITKLVTNPARQVQLEVTVWDPPFE
jgi:hypothetical protein